MKRNENTPETENSNTYTTLRRVWYPRHMPTYSINSWPPRHIIIANDFWLWPKPKRAPGILNRKRINGSCSWLKDHFAKKIKKKHAQKDRPELRANSAKEILDPETEIDFKELHKTLTFLLISYIFFRSPRCGRNFGLDQAPNLSHSHNHTYRTYIYTILTKNVAPKRQLTATTTTGLREPATKDERITNGNKKKRMKTRMKSFGFKKSKIELL